MYILSGGKMANKKIRYEKYSEITVNNKKYALIDYIGILRKNKGIKKADISRILRNNDTWYSQVEMGKKDNLRIKYIGREDLINIISIIKFGALNDTDLRINERASTDYLDNELKATPLDIIPREMPVYEMLREIEKMTTPEFSKDLINYSINGFIDCIQTLDNALNDPYKKQALSHVILQMKQNLLLHPASALFFYGLPFCDFFQQPNISAKEQDILAVELTKDLTDLFIKYRKLLPSDNTQVITKSINDALDNIKKFEYGRAWPFYS